jgi:predicted transcriptional regulator
MNDLDKVYERVLEIQKNIEISDTQQQGLIMNELINVISQIEQSLAEVKNDISKLENTQDEDNN